MQLPWSTLPVMLPGDHLENLSFCEGFWNAQKKGCREQSSPILLHRTHNLKLGERHTAGVCYLTRPLTNLLSVFRTITTTAPFPRRRATPRAAAGCTTQMPSAPT